ncbi:hypothetical protein STEG23_011951, partial [Scotinomys teguina]
SCIYCLCFTDWFYLKASHNTPNKWRGRAGAVQKIELELCMLVCSCRFPGTICFQDWLQIHGYLLPVSTEIT